MEVSQLWIQASAADEGRAAMTVERLVRWGGAVVVLAMAVLAMVAGGCDPATLDKCVCNGRNIVQAPTTY